MKGKFVILAAGLGTRNTVYPGLHKALLPIQDKPAISHIISNVPEDLEIIVAIGHLKDQLRTYLRFVYPNRKITFVEIDPYEGPSSGPGITLLQCKHLLNEPFIFTSVDTLLSEDLKHKIPEFDWIGVNHEEPVEYACVFQSSGKPAIMRQKQHPIFIGIAGIYDHVGFWKRLAGRTGNDEVTTGFDNPKLLAMQWTDVGSDATYKLLPKSKLVPAKEGQILFIDNDKVIKYFKSSQTAANLQKRAGILDFNSCRINDNMIGYKYIEGTLLSSYSDIEVIDKILNKVWYSWIPETDSMISDCEEMYRQKTLQRVADFIVHWPEIDKIKSVNGLEIQLIEAYLDQIDWDELNQDFFPCHFHGDLQPENIIIDGAGDPHFIDWRESFGSSFEIGDMYYDWAKLFHACIVNNAIVLKDKYDVNINGDQATISIEFNEFLIYTLERLHLWIKDTGLDWDKICILGILQYVTIASLYKDNEKYRTFLFLLGKYLLEHMLNLKNEPITVIESVQRRVS